MTTQTHALVDTSVMPTLHTFFRREFRLAGGVVRGVADPARGALVADHVAYLQRALHTHHTVEDDILWPLLLQRVPDELAPIVHLMESQHARVEGLLEEVTALLPGLRAADTAARDRLADVLDTLYLHLAEHLDAEEERLLPIAARAVTQAEWEEMGARARQGQGQAEGILVLGMIAYEGDPAVVAQMLAEAPAPVRWLLPKLARRAFRRRALVIHGTATP
jgi:hemerythrin-like domain-containing protein